MAAGGVVLSREWRCCSNVHVQSGAKVLWAWNKTIIFTLLSKDISVRLNRAREISLILRCLPEIWSCIQGSSITTTTALSLVMHNELYFYSQALLNNIVYINWKKVIKWCSTALTNGFGRMTASSESFHNNVWFFNIVSQCSPLCNTGNDILIINTYNYIFQSINIIIVFTYMQCLGPWNKSGIKQSHLSLVICMMLSLSVEWCRNI